MKKLLFVAALVFSLTSLVSCKKEDTNNTTVSSSNAMTGSQQVPANSSTATGTVNITYNKENKNLTYTITWSGLTSSATAIHIHGPAVAGVNASAIVAINGFPAAASGSVSGSLMVSSLAMATAEADLLAGKWYLSISTVNYPAGEIRGQITF